MANTDIELLIIIGIIFVCNILVLVANLIISKFSKSMTAKIAFRNFFIGIGIGFTIFIPIGMILIATLK